MKSAFLALTLAALACRAKPPAPAAEPQQHEPGVHRLDERGLTPPALIRATPPSLNPGALRIRSDGDVFVFEGILDETGQVRKLRTVQAPVFTPPSPEIESAYKDAVRSWVYTPAELYGRPVSVFMTFRIGFSRPPESSGTQKGWTVQR